LSAWAAWPWQAAGRPQVRAIFTARFALRAAADARRRRRRKRSRTRAGWVLNFDGGKIKESRHYFDMLSFMQQLGVLPR
jgi:ketosteroid isomerase-like protein